MISMKCFLSFRFGGDLVAIGLRTVMYKTTGKKQREKEKKKGGEKEKSIKEAKSYVSDYYAQIPVIDINGR